ncbi:hypothetical protein XELAEV_18007302mg [Xenopus laevis]|uniref:Immunoglobulin V-set domain-containing protein n=1 Tax=Xenopus laevis TaxID=8355 RepID=A0A974E2S0_XENLA|nr:hypothetical protein XELAEV_18007302mg [Xenopus laevis]
MVQERSITVVFGGKVRLGCTGYTFIFSYIFSYIAWLKHVPGKDVMYIGGINPEYENTWFSPSFKEEKFTITTNNEESTGYLQIDNVAFEDAAVHYCARDTNCEY